MSNLGALFQARPTVYKGIKMRSRLEAQWAAKFDEDKASGIINDWDYEPECFADETGQYLPDFQVEREDGVVCYIEVKPWGYELEPDEWLRRMEIIHSSHPAAPLRFFCGIPTLAATIINDGNGWVEV